MVFPQTLPQGYHYIDETVTYNPAIHLALEFPTEVIKLSDLGYSKDDIVNCLTDFAVSSPTRLLSDEGVSALLNVTKVLRQYVSGSERIQNMVRGGVYRSRFLRDLCLCPQVSEFLSTVYGTKVAPHSFPLQLGHLNFAPDDLTIAVDKWHHDTLTFDYVLMVTNPNEISGGEFQYFLGIKAEANVFAQQGKALPEERVVTPHFPGAGYALMLHGAQVVHRANKLNKAGERITMVNGYVPLSVDAFDYHRLSYLKEIDPHHVLLPEWTRYKAWQARGKLDRLINELPFTEDSAVLTQQLKEAVVDIELAIKGLSEDYVDDNIKHYGD